MEFRFPAEDEDLPRCGRATPQNRAQPDWADMSKVPATEGAASDERWASTRDFHRSLTEREVAFGRRPAP